MLEDPKLPSNYDKYPAVKASATAEECQRGWPDIADQINHAIDRIALAAPFCVVAVECYTGLHEAEISRYLRRHLRWNRFFTTDNVFLPPDEIDIVAAPYLGGDDPVFGRLCPLTLEAFLDPVRRQQMQQDTAEVPGVSVVFGTGALLCCVPDLIVYADMPRWEGQLRQRRSEVPNLGMNNHGAQAALQYKRSFFVDWRVCDRLKRVSMPQWDFLLDTTQIGDPKLLSGTAYRAALRQAAHQPFRVVPFFDPAPWGGQWLREVCDLDPNAPNYGWGFDCVPEENSLLLKFGETAVEIPAQNLVYGEPSALLGESVYGLFGPEFPIRFDFLDTVGGGNLSLQVHPPTVYAQEQFGIHYTQDESYYILDAGEDATVYLGLKPDAGGLFEALEAAQLETGSFDADAYVSRWPAKKHDHFLIPAGTIHCSGAETVVLEISATPYLFTFKLWDWNRLGLDGHPRPINLARGQASLQTERDTRWTEANLLNVFVPITASEAWREEKTGLHALEFIETRRHWFTGTVPHHTQDTVNVLNLVQGREAIVESPSGVFAPFIVHFAETFIVPAAVGEYTIRPHGESIGTECATLKAFVGISRPSENERHI